MNTIKVLVVKDEEGQLRPQAGIWEDNEAGKYNAEYYLQGKYGKSSTIAKATLTEQE